MTLCVAPLTTVVMNAVDDDRAGLASGVNNTAARLAGVLAIALLTAVAVSAFSSSLEGRLQDAAAYDDVREQLLAQSAMLADLDVPADMEDAAGIGVMIDQSYVDAFRQIALACAVAAFLSAGISWLTLRPKRARSSR
jgi:hypothetical protein